MHPLDTVDRQQMVQEDEGLGLCNITKCCTEVCPEHIKITDNAIIPMKERVVDRKYDPLVFLGSKIGLFKGTSRKAVGPAGGDGPSPIKHPMLAVPDAPVAKKTVAKKAVAKKAPAKRAVAAKKAVPAKKVVAKKAAPARKTVAKKTAR
jgi:hypothetical protein